MSSSEVAAHFGEEVPVEKPMTEEDLYAIAARVKNAARMSVGGNLTATGEQLCNSFVHLFKAFYDFADTLNDKDKERLKELVRSQEIVPGDFIAMATPKRK
jgi:hypothetical protein